MDWIWTVLSVLVFLYTLKILKNKKKNLPPGPPTLPILGHLHLLGKNPHQDLHGLAQKHGPIMGLRFGFVPTLVLSSPDAAELVLKTHDHVFASRPRQDAVSKMTYDQRSLVFSPYGSYWRNMRKLCTLELLSSHRIKHFQAMRRAELGEFIRTMKQAADRRERVDLSAGLMGLSEDMNCLMLFRRKFADRDFDKKGFKDVMSETVEVTARFNLSDYFPYIGVFDLQGINRRVKDLSKVFDTFLEKIVDDHVKNKKNEDFVDTMMALIETGKLEFQFDRRHVKAVLVDLLIAGADTSAATVEWALSELIRHPHEMKKLKHELASIVGMDQMVEESHLEKLEYLECIVKETLRLHPVAPLLISHESMEDCVINGFYIPKKSRTIVNVWAIGRDPNAWSNPEAFLPARFIGTSIDLKGHDFQLIPFGSGRRSCPGMELGLVMVRLVLAQLVHCFDWDLPDDMEPSGLDMSEQFGTVMSRAKHLMAIPTYRLQK